MKNANPKKNPITTYPGLILVAISTAMAIGLFIDYTPYTIVKVGITIVMHALGWLLVLSPDSVVTGANKVINKGTDKL